MGSRLSRGVDWGVHSLGLAWERRGTVGIGARTKMSSPDALQATVRRLQARTEALGERTRALADELRATEGLADEPLAREDVAPRVRHGEARTKRTAARRRRRGGSGGVRGRRVELGGAAGGGAGGLRGDALSRHLPHPQSPFSQPPLSIALAVADVGVVVPGNAAVVDRLRRARAPLRLTLENAVLVAVEGGDRQQESPRTPQPLPARASGGKAPRFS